MAPPLHGRIWTPDRRRRVVVASGGGGNLVTNGDFSTGDLTGWTDSNSHWSVVGGKAYHAPSSAFNTLLTTGIPSPGNEARIRFTISGLVAVAGRGVRVQFRDSGNNPIAGPLYGASQTNSAAVDGSYDITVTVPASAVYLAFARDIFDTVTEFYVDDVIVENA